MSGGVEKVLSGDSPVGVDSLIDLWDTEVSAGGVE